MAKFPFTTRDVTLMAAFLALLMVTEVVWVLGTVVGNFVYGILFGAVLIIAAIVVGKKYTILTLGIVKTIIELFFAPMYGGTLMALSYLAGAIVLEAILQLSEPYAASNKMNIIGATLYAFSNRLASMLILIFIYGMTLPGYIIVAYIVINMVTFAIGGFLGNKIGIKVKGTLESV
ncbi:hypothetical protein [Methanobacterium petrolearium]|uniref:hypothetical protein n=1 Tax=Methanobacterium petrolearium TaxID=710190 RepID=UPI001AE8E4AE|nr:hypothetical protein [Methanobacterium petrolearium]MBP1946009.1 hypothetical protein [Methanobacterium petrolearium]BDZ70864.1 hypothetical protein GCM10025861_13810 [Methanobacterium petrolearium]